jgi:hypothetical protein
MDIKLEFGSAYIQREVVRIWTRNRWNASSFDKEDT